MKTAVADGPLVHQRVKSNGSELNPNRFNLNLLPSLKALLENKSVTHAAQALCVTQPTMSRNLAQLREALCDPLLVRKGHQTTLSPLARTLQPQVNQALREAQAIFGQTHFNPSSSRQHFRIASCHTTAEQILPHALHQIREKAPRVTFEIKLLEHTTVDRLQTGALDLAIGYPAPPTAGLRGYAIFHYPVVCLMGRQHPLAKQLLSAEQLAQYPHISYSSGWSLAPPVQSYYNRYNIEPAVVNPIPASVQQMLTHGNYLCLHSGLTEFNNARLCVRPMPDNFPDIEARMVWPEYWHNNRCHRWLRDELYQHITQVDSATLAATPPKIETVCT